MTDGPEWFAPKKFGMGSGLPISWQGWLLTIVFLAVAAGAVILLGDRPWAVTAIVVPAALMFMLIASRTTRGFWRWRHPGGD